MCYSTYNLVVKPWIKVKYNNDFIREISLKQLFTNAVKIKELANDTPQQDVTVLRLLLAIMLTVYQRNDIHGSSYRLDRKADELKQTWVDLYRTNNFNQVLVYLDRHQDEFDFFSKTKPFMQVTVDDYNAFIKAKFKAITDKANEGKPANSLINRTINQSSNSVSTFAHTPILDKQDLSPIEFIRWTITYQYFAGTSDKPQFQAKDKWNYGTLYAMTPIYFKGANLAKTLILNLTLIPRSGKVNEPKPIWEQDMHEYLTNLLNDPHRIPDNLPELFTVPSRMFYVIQSGRQLQALVAKLPSMLVTDNTLWNLETMSPFGLYKKNNYYELNKIKKDEINNDLWQNLGLLFTKSSNSNSPKITQPYSLTFLQDLYNDDYLGDLPNFSICTTGMIDDDNPNSRMPIYFYHDSLDIDSNIVLSANTIYRDRLLTDVEEIKHVAKDLIDFAEYFQTKSLVNKIKIDFYSSINLIFRAWLKKLTIDCNLDDMEMQLSHQIYRVAKHILDQAAQSQINLNHLETDKKGYNLFTARNKCLYWIGKDLKING